MAVIVETKELVETVVASLIAGVGVTVIFSIGIWGAARFADFSRAERRLAAGAAGTLAVLAGLATAAVVVLGVVIMSSK